MFERVLCCIHDITKYKSNIWDIRMDAKKFGEHLLNLNNYGITLAAVAFGNEIGLFDLLMRERKPLTSIEIAEKANMKERYVREWLGCMVAAQLVILENDKYLIPSEQHETMKGAIAYGNVVVSLVKRFDKTKACFDKNGPWGNNYDADDNFWFAFGGFREKTGDRFLQTAILPALDANFKGKLESGSNILDLGCGTGTFSISLAQRYPKSNVVGLDACERPLKIANGNLQKNSMCNLKFIMGDALNLAEELENQFDLVFFCECLHDLPDPQRALRETAKVLKADGKLVIIELQPHSNQADNAGDMLAAMFYSCSMFCCLQNSLLVEPRIGYGACWGQEDMTKAIEEVFRIEKKVELPMLHAIYICTR